MLSKTPICLTLISGLSLAASARGGQSDAGTGWPCAGKVDPSYIRTAEATGGKVMLFKPGETMGAADDLLASNSHKFVVFRATGQVDDGVHDFEIPVDSTIESVYVFVSLQCLQSVKVTQPSGEELRADDPEIDYHGFEATRLFTIKAPTTGTWRVTMAGHGFFSVIVKAKTNLALTGVSLVQDDVPIRGLAPLGTLVRLEATTMGELGDVGFDFISMDAALLESVDLELRENTPINRTYAADVLLPTTEFRVLMRGIDSSGFPFQRVTERLFVGDR